MGKDLNNTHIHNCQSVYVADNFGFNMNVDEVDTDTTYVGETIPGNGEAEAKWRIKKIFKEGTVTKIRFADASPLFNKVWSDRLTYGY